MPIQREDGRSCAIAVIASAGGIPATIQLLKSLQRPLWAPIVVAQHLPRVPSSFDRVLSFHTSMKVCWAEDGDEPRGGHVYLSRPGFSLEFTPNGFRVEPLAPGPVSWLALPDLLLESMCETYDSRSAAVVLSGALSTALKGLKRVRMSGGFTLAQSEKSSEHFEMPMAAIDWGKAEIVTSPARMAAMLEIISGQWQAMGAAA